MSTRITKNLNLQAKISGQYVRMAIGTLLWCVLVSSATAQDSSLMRRRWPIDRNPPLTSETASFIFHKPEPLKVLGLHDIVTVVVNINSRTLSEGEVENRKRANLSMVLKDWIGFDGFGVIPDPQTQGDPKIDGQLNSQFRAEADLETRNTMTFTIAAKVIDVRPNGNLIIEARQTSQSNDEVWELSLTGVIRREDVAPDNKVLSEDVADLRVFKREGGQVRDGYRRGWLQKLYDRFQPF